MKVTEFHPALQEVLQSYNTKSDTTEAQLFSFLREKVGKLPEKETEKLWQILYRLDVSEKQVREILAVPDPDFWPSGIADLILKREKQRQYWSERYKNDSNASCND